MKHMYVIYVMEYLGHKSNVAIDENEDAAKKSILGLRANGMLAGYEKLEVWKQADIEVK